MPEKPAEAKYLVAFTSAMIAYNYLLRGDPRKIQGGLIVDAKPFSEVLKLMNSSDFFEGILYDPIQVNDDDTDAFIVLREELFAPPNKE